MEVHFSSLTGIPTFFFLLRLAEEELSTSSDHSGYTPTGDENIFSNRKALIKRVQYKKVAKCNGPYILNGTSEAKKMSVLI